MCIIKDMTKKEKVRALNKKEKRWGLVILILVLCSFVMPYTIFREVTTWYGSFLLWTILAVVVIAINVKLTEDWSEEE